MVPQWGQPVQGLRCFTWSPPTEESEPTLGLAAEVDVRSERLSTHSNVGRPDEIKAMLAHLTRRRDAFRDGATRLAEAKQVAIDEADLRRWAKERFESFA
jgi:hypothetical protein